MAAYAASKSMDSEAKADWISVQKKTFTRWANNKLKKRNMQFDDLVEGFKDGVLPINLLEVIGGESVKQVLNVKYNKKPKIKIQKLENGNHVINYCRAKGVDFVNVGANDFEAGNERIILGFMWKVILRFVVSEDGQQGLLLWCQRSCKPYDNIKIKNFHRSWQDGLGFVGIIHRYRPDLIADPATLSPENAAENCELAFSVAEEKLGIPRLLDVEDVVGTAKPDDKSIATYMNEFYLLFATALQAEHYIQAILKATAVTRRHDDMIARYNAGAADLAGWTADQTTTYSNFDYGTTTEQIKTQLMNFYGYRNADKPSRAGQLIDLTGTLNSLRSSCNSNNRPVFEPADNIKPEALEGAWTDLEELENRHEAKLRDMYTTFQEIDFAVEKFRGRADKLERWIAEKSDLFEAADFGSGVVGAEICANSFEIYERQLAKYQQASDDLGALAKRCGEVPEHSGSAEVVDRNTRVAGALQDLTAAGTTYKAALDAHLAQEERIAELEKQISTEGALASYDTDDIRERISEPVVAGQVAALQEKLNELNGPLTGDVANLTDRLAALKDKIDELHSITGTGGDDDGAGLPLRRSSTNSSQAGYEALVAGEGEGARLADALSTRISKLEADLAKEGAKEDLRRGFADAANAVRAECEGRTKQLTGLEGEPEAQLEALDTLSQGHAESKIMEPAEATSKACDDAGVVINPYTPETIFTLRSQWEELGKAYKQARNIAEKAIIDKAGTQLTPEQIAEIREVFDYFDEDKDGKLCLKEFQDGLQGMGMVMDEESSENAFRSLGGGSDLSFDLFSSFMSDQMRTGTTHPDVIAAFQSLASGETIGEDAIATHFGPHEDYADYLLANMPAAEAGRDYVAFTDDLFTR